MKRSLIFSFSFYFFCIIFIFFYSCAKDVGSLPITSKSLCDSLKVKYAADIKPIIQAQCAVSGCHNTGGLGNGDFTTYAGLSAKADAPLGNGSLRKRTIDGVQPTMPPGLSLSTLELQKIDCWLKNGAPDN